MNPLSSATARPGPGTAATSIAVAAGAVADALVASGLPMPSVYVAIGGRLRCIAQRGYWQVHDGVPLDAGVIGRAYTTGTPQLISDVRDNPHFVAAATGVVAEVAVPLRHGGTVVGVLNVESQRLLLAADIEAVRRWALALEVRIHACGGIPAETPFQRLAREASELGRLQDRQAILERAVEVARELSGMTTAAVLALHADHPQVLAATGALEAALRQLGGGTLGAMGMWSSAGASVTSAGQPGVGFAGAQAVWEAGIASIVAVPVALPGGVPGVVIAADAAPEALHTDHVQVLELFAAHMSTALHAADALAEQRRQAACDVLTGLGHHATFHEHLELERSRPGRRRGLAVVLIDVDGFKTVNDTAGHMEGDRLLVALAGVLGEQLREPDLVCRIGGDEFAALVAADSAEQAAVVAERLRRAASAAALPTLSIGIAFCDADDLATTTAEQLRTDADLALYEAKRSGRDRVEVFEPRMREAVLGRAVLAGQLAGAIDRAELHLDYQPVVDLGSASILGTEALLRWRHPERGLVPPLDFIPIAEEDGQIRAIGAWVLLEACRVGARWAGRHPGERVKVGLNVSGLQLDEGFPELVDATLRQVGLPADALVVEITESALVDDPARIDVLARLRAGGVHVAVDDFGTGYSSLSYLRRLPVDILKIDRSFVAALDDPRSAAIVRTVVDLSRTLGLSSVAEGVESADQARQLLELGCEHAQGYWFSRPVEAVAMDALLRTGLPHAVPVAGAAPRP